MRTQMFALLSECGGQDALLQGKYILWVVCIWYFGFLIPTHWELFLFVWLSWKFLVSNWWDIVAFILKGAAMLELGLFGDEMFYVFLNLIFKNYVFCVYINKSI